MTTIAIFVALLIALLILRHIYSRHCMANVSVQVFISSNTATEGDKLILTEVITNQKWLPLPWLAVKFQVDRELEFGDSSASMVSDLYYRNDLFHILMHQKITRRLGFTCTKRGYYAIRGLEITGWDILMENKYIRRYDCDAQLTVYPATFDAEEVDNLCTQVYGQLPTRHPVHIDPFTFRGIREYSWGDPIKSINFKASAKAMALMVNVWDFVGARQIILLLDVQRHIVWYREALEERAIKIAASLAQRMSNQGLPLGFVTNGLSVRSGLPTRVPEGRGAGHLRGIFESLAYIDLSKQDIEPFSAVLDRITAEGYVEPEYWLISPYYDKGLAEALVRLKKSGGRVVWIMPEPRPIGEVFGGMEMLDRIVWS